MKFKTDQAQSTSDWEVLYYSGSPCISQKPQSGDTWAGSGDTWAKALLLGLHKISQVCEELPVFLSSIVLTSLPQEDL